MPSFVATILVIEAESNPEEVVLRLEAKSLADAKKQAETVMAGDMRGLGKRSFGDLELWGKEQRTLIDVATKEAYEAMAGTGGNSTGPRWSQDEHHAFLRKGAK